MARKVKGDLVAIIITLILGVIGIGWVFPIPEKEESIIAVEITIDRRGDYSHLYCRQEGVEGIQHSLVEDYKVVNYKMLEGSKVSGTFMSNGFGKRLVFMPKSIIK